jgi:predicted nucleic acid-binding protein
MSHGGTSPGLLPSVDVVVDTSVAVKWFIPENHSAEAGRFLGAGFWPHIPVLLYSELTQTIWKKVYQRKEIATEDGREILRDLMVIPLQVHPVTPLLEQALDIALATGRTVYDSLYLALAVSLDCKLVTADQKLYNALRIGPFADDVLWVADPDLTALQT